MKPGGLEKFFCAAGLHQKRCAHCYRPFNPEKTNAPGLDLLCPECRGYFACWTGPRCPRCGLPWPPGFGAQDVLCGQCINDDPPWSACAFYGLYAGCLRDIVLRLKYGAEFSLLPLFAAFLQSAARSLPVPDAVLAVPQHPDHLRERGFNQACELARALHRASGWPLRLDLLERTRQGRPQAGLDAVQRAQNVRGAFRGLPAARGLRLCLIDDTMTTGSTLREACRSLLGAGAAEVYILAVARTPLLN